MKESTDMRPGFIQKLWEKAKIDTFSNVLYEKYICYNIYIHYV